MVDLPRIVITREQAKRLWEPCGVHGPDNCDEKQLRYTAAVTTTEQPVKPCLREHVEHGKVWSEDGVTPITPGDRVQVGWWEYDVAQIMGTTETVPYENGFHSVAVGTVVEIEWDTPDTAAWHVTIADLEPCNDHLS